MLLYNSVFVKKENQDADYDVTTNYTFWSLSIITCILKWVFSIMYLARTDGTLSLAIILLVLPICRLCFIGIPNIIDFCRKFTNNFVRILMFLMSKLIS